MLVVSSSSNLGNQVGVVEDEERGDKLETFQLLDTVALFGYEFLEAFTVVFTLFWLAKREFLLTKHGGGLAIWVKLISMFVKIAFFVVFFGSVCRLRLGFARHRFGICYMTIWEVRTVSFQL